MSCSRLHGRSIAGRRSLSARRRREGRGCNTRFSNGLGSKVSKSGTVGCPPSTWPPVTCCPSKARRGYHPAAQKKQASSRQECGEQEPLRATPLTAQGSRSTGTGGCAESCVAIGGSLSPWVVSGKRGKKNSAGAPIVLYSSSLRGPLAGAPAGHSLPCPCPSCQHLSSSVPPQSCPTSNILMIVVISLTAVPSVLHAVAPFPGGCCIKSLRLKCWWQPSRQSALGIVAAVRDSRSISDARYRCILCACRASLVPRCLGARAYVDIRIWSSRQVCSDSDPTFAGWCSSVAKRTVNPSFVLIL
jgi:hypothetical protein